jgi:cell division protein FtsI (penicillin-binding protein 3)
MELLQWMGSVGALPGILVGVALVLGWAALWSWLRRVATGPDFSVEMRRMGLALVALHGLATLSYVLFNLGLTRHSAGLGAPPFVPQVAWWLLGAALTGLVVQASRASKPTGVDGAGKQFWISLVGYVLVGSLLATVIVVIKESQRIDQYGDFSKRTGYATRDVIRDANSKVIAQNVLAYDLWFRPTDFWAPSLLNPRDSAPEDNGHGPRRTDAERERILLAALKSWPSVQGVVQSRLALWPRDKDSMAILAWAITPEMADAIKALAMHGVLIKPRTARHYPDGPLYAHAVGFASLADTLHGQEGLELVANRQLATVAANAGANHWYVLQTTLVPSIQKGAQDALQAGIKDHHAKGGAIVVLDVQKNEIAALVSAPDFDPNDLSTYRNPYQPDRILNRATSLSFPIGELITPLIAAHGIESGRVAAQAKMNLAELQALCKTLGLGEPFGIPGLTGGVNAERTDGAKWTPEMHASPGLAIETNLMQVLKAYLPIATSGYLRTPTLLASTHGDMYGKRVLSPETAAAMRRTLKIAGPFSSSAPHLQGFESGVAGIAATMRGNFWKESAGGKKLARSDTSAFVGMLPAEKPKWLVAVLMEFAPGKGRLTGLSAEPVFAQVVRKGILQESLAKPGTTSFPQ